MNIAVFIALVGKGQFIKTLKLLLALALLTGCGRAGETPQAAPVAPPAVMPPPAFAPAPLDTGFIVRDNDIWVMVGDSITEQKLYSAYLEAFTRARYPKLPFVAVHSGKSGEVYIQGLIRFGGTVAAYKPTLVTVNYGMNDHVKVFAGDDFQDDPRNPPQRFMQSVAALKIARLYMMTASPLLAPADFGQSVEALLDPANAKKPRDRSNPVGQLFADKLKLVAARNNVPVLDQMAPLQQIWAANFERDTIAAVRKNIAPLLETSITAENLRNQANAISAALRPLEGEELPLPDRENFPLFKPPGKSGTPEEWEAFRVYLQSWGRRIDNANPPFARVSGYSGSVRASDLIHPNEAGHLHMAGVLWKLMNADGLVSDVKIDAKTQKVTAQKATVSQLSFTNGVLSFKRLDESLPLPIDPAARPGLGVDAKTDLGTPKDLFGMSRYFLSVTGLPKGDYSLAIDGEAVATASADELAAGLDLGLSEKGPVAAQSLRLWQTVSANLKSPFGTAPTSPPVEPTVLTEAQPVEHVWTLTPVKK